MAVSILGMAERGTKGGGGQGDGRGPMALLLCFLLPRGQATEVFLPQWPGVLASHSVSEEVS